MGWLWPLIMKNVTGLHKYVPLTFLGLKEEIFLYNSKSESLKHDLNILFQELKIKQKHNSWIHKSSIPIAAIIWPSISQRSIMFAYMLQFH